jgi:transcriptional regulator with XRE-family HTH domain
MDGLGRGQRIARARRRRGLSQATLAGLVGRSESWLSQVERGLREVDSHTVLMSLAEVLRVEITDLTGDEASSPQASRYAAARQIERAMMAYDSLESVIGAGVPLREPDLARLRLAVDRVNRAYQAARYDEVGRMLPGLIRGVDTAARTCPSGRSIWLMRLLPRTSSTAVPLTDPCSLRGTSPSGSARTATITGRRSGRPTCVSTRSPPRSHPGMPVRQSRSESRSTCSTCRQAWPAAAARSA